MKWPFRKPPPPPPELRPAVLQVVQELDEAALPGPFRDYVYTAGRESEEALAATRALFSRVSEVEQALEDPALGLPRVRALEQEFDRLCAVLRNSHNLSFQRKQPNP